MSTAAFWEELRVSLEAKVFSELIVMRIYEVGDDNGPRGEYCPGCGCAPLSTQETEIIANRIVARVLRSATKHPHEQPKVEP